MFDIQAVVGGRKYEITLEESTYAAMTLYLDIFTFVIMSLFITGTFCGGN
jgi:FtsH-binding integral membrane protein